MPMNAKASGAVIVDVPDGPAVINGHGSSSSLTATGLSATITDNGSTGAITATATAGPATVSGNSSSSGITATAAGGAVTVDHNGAMSGGKAGGITVRGSGGPIAVTANGAISSGGSGIDVQAADASAITITVTKGLSAGATAVTAATGGSAAITIGAGASGHAVAVQCNAAGGATVTNTGSVSAAAAADTGAGSLTFNNMNAAASGFTAAAGTVSTYNNGPSAHWSLSSAGSYALDGQETFNNQGLFELKRYFFQPPYQVTFAGLDVFHNQSGGTISLAAQTTLALTGNDSFVNDGTVTLGSDAQLIVDGTAINQGTIVTDAGAGVTFQGPYEAGDGARLVATVGPGGGPCLTLNGTGSGVTRMSLLWPDDLPPALAGCDLVLVANAGKARFELDNAPAAAGAPFADGAGVLVREDPAGQLWFGREAGAASCYVLRHRAA